MPPETVTALAERPSRSREALAQLEKVVTQGDLATLSQAERIAYYGRVSESLGLNPLTRPFEYLTLNGRQILYVRKDATDQLRKINGISITRLDREETNGLLTVTAYGSDRSGRTDSSIGAVSVAGLRGNDLANAYMKAETKAKRRLTLSLAGLGWLDESEVGSVTVDVDAPVAATRVEAIAARRLGANQPVEEAAAEAAESYPAVSEPPPPLPKDRWGRRLHGQAAKAGLTHQDLHDHAVERWGVSSITELDAHQRADLMEMVESAIEAPPEPVTVTGEDPESSGAPEGEDGEPALVAANTGSSVAIPHTPGAFAIFAAAALDIETTGDWGLTDLSSADIEEVVAKLGIEDYDHWFAGCSRELRAVLRNKGMSPRGRADRATRAEAEAALEAAARGAST